MVIVYQLQDVILLNCNGFSGLGLGPSSQLGNLTMFSPAVCKSVEQEFGKKEDDLNSADDGEACEESHGATNETQLSLRLDLLVPFNVVKGRRVKEDPDKPQCGLWQLHH